MSDLIDRRVLLTQLRDAENHAFNGYYNGLIQAHRLIADMPSALPEPSEITNEQAILHLQSTGWMQNHDREMYESGVREQLADDSGGYDTIIPCEDTISRQDAIDAVNTWDKIGVDERGRAVRWHEGLVPYVHLRDVVTAIVNLPSVQSEPSIPLQWIEAQIELLKSLDNAFLALTAGQISAMVNKWKDEQDG